MPTTLFIPLLPSPLGCSCFARATMPFNIACLGAAPPAASDALRSLPPPRPVANNTMSSGVRIHTRCRRRLRRPLRIKYSSFGRACRCTPAKSRHPNYTTFYTSTPYLTFPFLFPFSTNFFFICLLGDTFPTLWRLYRRALPFVILVLVCNLLVVS